MTDQWRPVENGEYESQHVTDSCIIEGEWLTVQERVVGSDDTEVATIALPDHLRLCERAETEPSEIENELYTALAFAKSCILSGEQWSEACDQMIDGALKKARGE